MPATRTLAVAAPLLLLSLMLAGCATGAKPTFEVVDAAVTERTGDGFVVTFLIEGRNPGDDALPLRTVKYSLSLGGDTVFRGVRSAEATLPRQGAQQFRLPVAVSRDEWPAGEQAATEAPYELDARVSYIAPGALAEILFDSGFRRPKVSFSERGVLTADAVALHDPAAAR